MSKTELPDLIRIVLNNAEGGLTSKELRKKIEESFDYSVSDRTLEDRLRELREKGEIERFRDGDGTRGQPPYRYTIEEEVINQGEDPSADQKSSSGPRLVGLRGDFSVEDYENLPDGVYWDVIKRQGESGRLVEELRDVADPLANEDPVELLTEMTGWAVDRLNTLGDELGRLLVAGQTEQMKGLRDEYDEFAQWCDGYFHGFWQLTAYDDPGDDLLRIPESGDILDAASDGEEPPRADCDEAGVRDRFERRVFGDSVLTRVKVDNQATDAVGTDASVAEVTLPSRSPLGVDTRLEVFAGAAALEHEDRRFTDYDFNPNNLREFRGRKAFRRGLIVSGEATPQLGEGELEKSRYAAMDLRQYKETTRVIDNEVDWRPHGDTRGELSDYTGPDVMYLDGRVTPLVHQMAQFASTSIYGELVRQEIREFGRIVDYADENNWHTDTVFAGIVKSPAISWFAPLVFWYLETRHKDEGPNVKRVYRPPIPDARLPHLLFTGLSDTNGTPADDEIFSTSLLWRRLLVSQSAVSRMVLSASSPDFRKTRRRS